MPPFATGVKWCSCRATSCGDTRTGTPWAPVAHRYRLFAEGTPQRDLQDAVETRFANQADFHREVGQLIKVTAASAKGTFHAFLNDKRPLPKNHRAAYIKLGIAESLLDKVSRPTPPSGTAHEWLAIVRVLLAQETWSPELQAVAEAAVAELERSAHALLGAAVDVRERITQEESASRPPAVQ